MKTFIPWFFGVTGISSIGVQNSFAMTVLSAFFVLAYFDWTGQGRPRPIHPFRPSPGLEPNRERAE